MSKVMAANTALFLEQTVEVLCSAWQLIAQGVEGLWEWVALDLLGPMNRMFQSLHSCGTGLLHKVGEAYPLPKDQAVTTAETITAEWLCYQGAPLALPSGQDSNFKSKVANNV